MKILKIAITVFGCYVASLVLSYFGYLFAIGLIPNCDFGCGFGYAIAAFFYIPLIALVVFVPLYIFARKLLKF